MPIDCRLAQLREQHDKNPPGLKWDASADEKTHVLRQLSSFVPVSCVQHGQKMRCTLPADVVSLGMFDPPEKIVFVSFGEVVEIWAAARWREAVGVPDFRSFTDEADEASN